MEGKEAGYLPVVSEDLYGLSCALAGKEVHDFFMEWKKKTTWPNRITIRR